MNLGNQSLNKMFEHMVKTNMSHAVSLLNQQTLSFPTFYLLIPQMLDHHLFEFLSTRNQSAITFCNNKGAIFDVALNRETLKWMLLTSIHQELESDEFQSVIDRAVIQLIVLLKEQTLLTPIVTLLFERNRKNDCVYDLCWALSQANTISTMPILSKYLMSNHPEDYHLACKLLNFKPELQPNNRVQQYQNFRKWFDENSAFLYFSNETMQETCQPKYWRVNLPAKYLCKRDLSEAELSEAELEQIKLFQDLNRESQKMLSKYSYRTYQKDKKEWHDWIKSPIPMQYQTCKERGGMS